tara:strand:+ start:741 stop:1778 length:1038 start_codon:yes stop_codon:yes gene_type:complete
MTDFYENLKVGPVFIVAELSANHNQDFDLAVETIKAAKSAGANAIKLQTYKPDTLTLNSKKKDFIISNNSIWDNMTYYDLYNKAFTPWEWHEKLFKVAKEIGLICFSTPFDKSSVDYLEKLNNPIYKVASFEITDIPLIKYIASKGKPIIFSSGISSEEDIKLAIKTTRDEGNDQIVLLKCTSSYPAPFDEANLIMIKDFKKKFKVITGLSDHTLGLISPIIATSLGARIIEKHLILNKNIESPDSSFSLTKNEFKEMVNAIRKTEKAIGKVDYNLTNTQKKGKIFSRSLYICKDVKEGEIITKNNIRSVRPGFGLHPKHYYKILGKKFKRNLNYGDRLNIEDIN